MAARLTSSAVAYGRAAIPAAAAFSTITGVPRMKYLPLLAGALLVVYASSAGAQDASASVSASVSASASVSEPSSTVSSALSSASSDLSSAVSSASSELSSTSSEVSSNLSSASSDASSSLANISCDTLNPSTIATIAIDPTALAAVTDVQVFALGDCAGLPDLAAMDAGATASIGTSPAVATALQAAGETGADIVGYTVEGATLIVYVKHRG
jgi:hypothetical protein